jgi:hypothetical protein
MSGFMAFSMATQEGRRMKDECRMKTGLLGWIKESFQDFGLLPTRQFFRPTEGERGGEAGSTGGWY